MPEINKDKLLQSLKGLFFAATCGGSFVSTRLQKQKDVLQEAINKLDKTDKALDYVCCILADNYHQLGDPYHQYPAFVEAKDWKEWVFKELEDGK